MLFKVTSPSRHAQDYTDCRRHCGHYTTHSPCVCWQQLIGYLEPRSFHFYLLPYVPLYNAMLPVTTPRPTIVLCSCVSLQLNVANSLWKWRHLLFSESRVIRQSFRQNIRVLYKRARRQTGRQSETTNYQRCRYFIATQYCRIERSALNSCSFTAATGREIYLYYRPIPIPPKLNLYFLFSSTRSNSKAFYFISFLRNKIFNHSGAVATCYRRLNFSMGVLA